MGAHSSSISELTDNEYLRRLASAEPVSHNDPFWNQLLSFSFATPTNSSDSRLLEEATESICKSLINNNPRTGNFAALVNVFISRTKELKISAECQNELFIWQAHNALFIVRCLIKALQSHTSEEELAMHFTYSPVTPGSCLESESEGGSLLEDMVLHLIHLIIEVPLLDITYCIHLEAVTTLMVLLAAQLHQRHVVRDGPLYYLFTQGRSCELASRLVKALMYHFIRQERCPPHISSPSAHARGSGLLSGLAYVTEVDFCAKCAGLWTVLTLGGAASGGKLAAPQQHAEGSSPLANQSLLLLLALMNLSETEEQANPYRRALLSFHNTQDKAPQEQPTFQINFNSLYTALCERQGTDEATLFLYLLLHQNTNVRTYVLARTDTETLVLPILQTLYHAEQKNSHHVYMSLIVLLIMSEDDAFNCSVHEVMLRNVPWYTERALSEISLGSLLILVVIRTIQYNMTRTRPPGTAVTETQQGAGAGDTDARRIPGRGREPLTTRLRAGPDGDRGGDPHDAGGGELVLVQFSAAQSEPGLYTALQAGALRAVPRAARLRRRYAEHRHRDLFLRGPLGAGWHGAVCGPGGGRHQARSHPSSKGQAKEIPRAQVQVCGGGEPRGVLRPLRLVAHLQHRRGAALVPTPDSALPRRLRLTTTVGTHAVVGAR
ncbi:dymeclin isoform X3 [Lampetra fluviatilis]